MPNSSLIDLFSIIQMLHQHQISYLPVLDEDEQLLGVVTNQSIQQVLPQEIDRCEDLETTPQQGLNQIDKILSHSRTIISRIRWRSHQEFEYEYISPSCENILGYADDEFLADPSLWSCRVLPEYKALYCKYFQEDITIEQTVSFEYGIYHKNGSICWICDTLNWEWQEATQSWLIISLKTDITKRKHTEEILRESEERLQLALEASGDGLWDWKISTAEVYFSPRWYEMLGYTTDELPNKFSTWEKLIHPEDKAWVEEILHSHLRNSSVPYAFEYRMQTKSGKTKWIANYGKVVMRDQNGQPLRMIGIHRDISDRKRAEEALQQSETLFRTLSDSAPIGIFRSDTQRKNIYTNPRFQAICGLNFAQSLGDFWMQFIHPEDLAEFLPQLDTLAISKQELCTELRYILADSTLRFCRLMIVPILSEPHELVGYVGTIEDITESRAIEKMKKEFISIVSHELRTPLASIRGALGLLAAGVLQSQPETSQQMLEIAYSDTERLVRLVNDILDLEHLESNKFTIVKQSCDTATLLRQSVEAVQPLATENQISLVILPSSITISLDPDRIMQTLVNLIGNAIKFSPTNSTVTLSVENLGDRVLFKVQDQGRGIPENMLENIFGRFHQVDASDSRQKGGTGLGLAICRGIVQQHGGRIWAESVLGEGSIFYFTIPKSNKDN